MRRLACVLLLSLAAAACGSGGAEPPASFAACTPRGLISPGERLPDCTFEGMLGQEPVSLSALRGTPVVLNFWASWCPFCINEMPDFDAVSSSLAGRVTFVGMNFLGGTQAETRPAAERLARETGVGYRLAYDPEGLLYAHFSRSVARPLMPLTVFVRADGTVAERHFGPLREEQLRAKIAEHLGVS